ATAQRLVTAEEYLAQERRPPGKHEVGAGQMRAMAGASRNHSLIAVNILAELRVRLRGKPCEVYPGDMRVRVRASGLYTYPDVSVVCGRPEFDDAEMDTLLNPTVLFEILSPSTEAYDRGEKFARYRQLPSLQEYVLVAQDRVAVECYRREGHFWVLETFENLDDTLRLPSIACELPLREVYDRIEFSNR
ncbi:MAG: Uma2 family endonuclease, partial [Caldilineales bacterium]|nr:Uma2 family endonuclease [Caldilineales bacterium]